MPAKGNENAVLIFRLPESLSPLAEEILCIQPGEVNHKLIDDRGVTIYFRSYSSAKKLIKKKTFDIDGIEYPIYPLITYLTLHNVNSGEWKNCLKKSLKQRISQKKTRIEPDKYQISLSETHCIRDRKNRNVYRVILNCVEDVTFHPPDILEDLKDPVSGKEVTVTYFCCHCREDGHYRRDCRLDEGACTTENENSISSDEKVHSTFQSYKRLSSKLLPPKRNSEDAASVESKDNFSEEDNIIVVEDDEDSAGQADYWKNKCMTKKNGKKTCTSNDNSRCLTQFPVVEISEIKASLTSQKTSESLVTTLVKSSSDTWAVKSKPVISLTQNEVNTEKEGILVIDISDDELVIDISDDELVIDISDDEVVIDIAADEVPPKRIKTDEQKHIEQMDSNSLEIPSIEPSPQCRITEKTPANADPTQKRTIQRIPVILGPDARLTVTVSFEDFKMTPPGFWESKKEFKKTL